MTIHDELIYELIKPDKDGKIGKDALIFEIVGIRKIDYELEESKMDYDYHLAGVTIREELVKMTPDIVVTFPEMPARMKEIAIELENDIDWDFAKSLRQVKKYKIKFEDTRVIIPEEYKRFAPFYKKENFRVYLWNTKRRWQCMMCGNITAKEGPVQPKCKECNKNTQHRLVGLKDTEIEEYV